MRNRGISQAADFEDVGTKMSGISEGKIVKRKG
jgi:hypothetical protein